MSKKQDDLYELLHNLSSSEKRYVKIFALKHMRKEQNSYLKLFNLLLSVTEYDEDQIDELLAKTGRRKSFATDKNYLYAFVLKAMRSFHEEKTIDNQLRELLISSSFLYEKRLYSQALKLLGKAKRLAYQYDKSTVLLEILFLESRNLIEKESKNQRALLEQLYQEVNVALAHIKEDWPLIMRQQRTFLLHRSKYSVQNDELREELDKISNFNVLINEPEPKRFTLAYYYLFTLALYYQSLAKHKEAASIYERLLQLWQKNPAKQKEASIQHKKNLSNYLTVSHALGQFERFPELIKQIEAIPCNSMEEEAEQFQNIRFAQLLLIINTHRFGELDELATIIKNGLIKYKTKINQARTLAFCYNISIAYFFLHQWKNALTWVEEIIRIDKTDHRQDIQNFARLYRLILLYELNKHDLLEYDLINAERFLRSRKSWFSFESKVAKHLRQLIEAEKSKRNSLFMKFNRELNLFTEEKEKPSPLGFTEISYWSRSVIQDIPMNLLLKEDTLQQAARQ